MYNFMGAGEGDVNAVYGCGLSIFIIGCMSMRVIVVLCQKDADSYRIWRYMQLPVYGYFATST